MATPEQLVTRVDPAVTARLASIAAASGQTVSEIVRRLIDAGIDGEETDAKKIAATAAKMPNGITEKSIDDAAYDLIRRINRSQPLTVLPHELLSPVSAAMYRILSLVWHDDAIADKTRTKLAGSISTPQPSNDDAGESRPVRANPRHASPRK